MNQCFKKRPVYDASERKLTQHVKRERAITGRTDQVSLGSGRAAGHKHHPYSEPGVGDRVQKSDYPTNIKERRRKPTKKALYEKSHTLSGCSLSGSTLSA